MAKRNRLLMVFVYCTLTLAMAHAALGQATEQLIFSFPSLADGNGPWGGVISDKQGNLYGATVSGGDSSTCGANGCGAAFQLTHQSDGAWAETILHLFGQGQDAAFPSSRMIFDSHGNLFGAGYYGGTGTCAGGAYPSCGAVFELSPSSSGTWTEKVLYSFQGGSDGQFPETNLVMDAQGNIYGGTQAGGGSSNSACDLGGVPAGCGTVFELTPNTDGSWSESIIYRFQGGSDGQSVGGLVWAGDGSLYGTTGGGLSCTQHLESYCGMVFRLRHSAGGWVKAVPYHFKGGSDGISPLSLTLDASGNLYGNTYFGGSTFPKFGSGTVYKLSQTSTGHWIETVLYRFTGLTDGCHPVGAMTFDRAGNLYGVTNGCGTSSQDSGSGTVYELTPSASGMWTETTVHTFLVPPDGINPLSGLSQDSSGNIYGTTSGGGNTSCGTTSGCGIVFEVTP